MYFNFRPHHYFIVYILLILISSVRSIIFVNVWNKCVDVTVEENGFPLSLIQTPEYYQVCGGSQAHWRRFGSRLFRMHIMRTSEPVVDKEIVLQHNGYVHLHNDTRLTVAKWYGAQHEDL